MRIGTSRQEIANKIQTDVFNRPLLRLICDPKDMIKIIIYSGQTPSEIFFSLCDRIREKLIKHEATLKAIYVINRDDKIKITPENSNKTLIGALSENKKLLFEVNIRNKLFYFEAKNE